MKSIIKTVNSEIIINKSKFINYLIPVTTAEEVKDKLSDLRKKYKDANHHCYAYVIGKNQEIQKYSDDGEPSKTAGMPMIEVLKKQGLTNILTVSIRYFGGIKLGAGGLVRAYTKSVSEAIKNAQFSFLVKITEIKISVSFDHIGHVEKYIRDNFILLNTEYSEKVDYFIKIENDKITNLVNNITEYTKGSAIIKELKSYEIYK
jgi:uncharacterized YigZ family protein